MTANQQTYILLKDTVVWISLPPPYSLPPFPFIFMRYTRFMRPLQKGCAEVKIG